MHLFYIQDVALLSRMAYFESRTFTSAQKRSSHAQSAVSECIAQRDALIYFSCCIARYLEHTVLLLSALSCSQLLAQTDPGPVACCTQNRNAAVECHIM